MKRFKVGEKARHCEYGVVSIRVVQTHPTRYVVLTQDGRTFWEVSQRELKPIHPITRVVSPIFLPVK